jgi:hypothetical protein
MEDELFLAWAAGFFDGEGCVLVEISKEKRCLHGFRTALHVNVTQTSLPCLELFLNKFGGVIVTSKAKTPNGNRWAVQHRWGVKNKNAVPFLKAIYPYAVVKKTQVAAALKYPVVAANGKNYGNSKNPIPNEVQDMRVAICHELRSLRAGMKEEALPAVRKHYAQ